MVEREDEEGKGRWISTGSGKSLTANGKSKEHNPKAGHHVSCKSCSKTFNSENALQSHSKAKHGGT